MVFVAGCSGTGAEDSAESGSTSIADVAPTPTSADDTVPGTSSPEQVPSNASDPTAVTEAPVEEGIVLGSWDWGAPCRVPVSETVGGAGTPIERSFVVDVAADDRGGYVLGFDDVVVTSPLPTAEAEAGLLDCGAVLAEMRLDRGGRFVEFVDLERDVAAWLEWHGENFDKAMPTSPRTVEAIAGPTIGAWYGTWLDRGPLPAVGEPQRSERHVADVPYDSLLKLEANEQGVAEHERLNLPGYGPVPIGSVHLWAMETIDRDAPRTFLDAVRSALPAVEDGYELVGRGSYVDRDTLRPEYSVYDRRLQLTMDGTTSSTMVYRAYVFDWEGAEGCAVGSTRS